MTKAPFSWTPRGTWTPQPRLLGLALPFVVALVCSYVDLSILMVVWLPFLLGVIGAAILRSWWALLAIPLALVIGTLVGIVPHGIHPTDPRFIAGTTLFILLALVEVTIGQPSAFPWATSWRSWSVESLRVLPGYFRQRRLPCRKAASALCRAPASLTRR